MSDEQSGGNVDSVFERSNLGSAPVVCTSFPAETWPASEGATNVELAAGDRLGRSSCGNRLRTNAGFLRHDPGGRPPALSRAPNAIAVQ